MHCDDSVARLVLRHDPLVDGPGQGRDEGAAQRPRREPDREAGRPGAPPDADGRRRQRRDLARVELRLRLDHVGRVRDGAGGGARQELGEHQAVAFVSANSRDG